MVPQGLTTYTMQNTQKIALLLAGLTTLVALVVLIDRDGVIAWTALLLGVALIVKIWRRPAAKDIKLAIGLAGVMAGLWATSFYYVISTYESGEVVELAIDTKTGLHSARVWILNVDAELAVYYEADPHVAEALLAGRPLQFTRGGVVSTRIPDAQRVDALPQEEADRILETMAAKYGKRMTAADVYYVLLGSPRDRVALVVKLLQE